MCLSTFQVAYRERPGHALYYLCVCPRSRLPTEEGLVIYCLILFVCLSTFQVTYSSRPGHLLPILFVCLSTFQVAYRGMPGHLLPYIICVFVHVPGCLQRKAWSFTALYYLWVCPRSRLPTEAGLVYCLILFVCLSTFQVAYRGRPGLLPYIICVFVHVPGCLQRQAWFTALYYLCVCPRSRLPTVAGLVIYCLYYLCVCPRSRLPTEEGLVIYCLILFVCLSTFQVTYSSRPGHLLPILFVCLSTFQVAYRGRPGHLLPYIICVFVHVPGCLQRQAWFTALYYLCVCPRSRLPTEEGLVIYCPILFVCLSTFQVAYRGRPGLLPYIICVFVHVPGCLQRQAWFTALYYLCVCPRSRLPTVAGLVIYCLYYLCVCPRSRLPTEEGLAIYCLYYLCVCPRSRLPTVAGLVIYCLILFVCLSTFQVTYSSRPGHLLPILFVCLSTFQVAYRGRPGRLLPYIICVFVHVPGCLQRQAWFTAYIICLFVHVPGCLQRKAWFTALYYLCVCLRSRLPTEEGLVIYCLILFVCLSTFQAAYRGRPGHLLPILFVCLSTFQVAYRGRPCHLLPYIICVFVHVPGCLQWQAWSFTALYYLCAGPRSRLPTEKGLVIYCLILFVCWSTFQVAYRGRPGHALYYLCVSPRSRLPTEKGLVMPYIICVFVHVPGCLYRGRPGLLPYIICVFVHVPGCLQRKALSFTAYVICVFVHVPGCLQRKAWSFTAYVIFAFLHVPGCLQRKAWSCLILFVCFSTFQVAYRGRPGHSLHCVMWCVMMRTIPWITRTASNPWGCVTARTRIWGKPWYRRRRQRWRRWRRRRRRRYTPLVRRGDDTWEVSWDVTHPRWTTQAN